MKITFIAPFFHPVQGGMENHILNLALELKKRGHNITVLTSNLSRNKKIKVKEEIYKNIKIKRFDSWFKIGDFGSFFPCVFIESIKSKGILHIHAYRHPSNLAVFLNKKTIITPHWPNYPKGLRKKWLEFMISVYDKTIGKLILKKSRCILAVSEPEINWLKNEFRLRRIKLIPNGIPKDYLRQRNKFSFKKKYNIKGKTVLYFGRIHKSKGIDQLIKVSKYFPKVNFIIMGNGPELNNLKLLSKNNNNIKFITGRITDEEKLEAFSAADVFIHPSHYDAFGITLLEAFSQGCPVIATDKGGLPWVVGSAGLIFRDNDINDLKTKLEYILINKRIRDSLSIKAKERAKDFTWDKIAINLEKIYKEI